MDDGLRELGPIGYFISAMATAIAGLSAAVAVQWRHANKVYGYRLAERDTLNDALTKAAASNLVLAESIRERNLATAAMSEAVSELAISNTMLHDKIGLILEMHTREQTSQVKVIESLAEAIRTQNGVIVDARNAANNVLGGISEMKAQLNQFARRPR